MTTSALNALAGTEQDRPDLTAGFGIGDIRPLMLEKDITLNGVFPEDARGESAPWEHWSHYLKQQAYEGWEALQGCGDDFSEEQLEAYWTPRLLYAVTMLPAQVRDATHKMLFGCATANPTIGALRAMETALFPHRVNDSWLRELYRKAACEHKAHQHQVARLNALLAVLEE